MEEGRVKGPESLQTSLVCIYGHECFSCRAAAWKQYHEKTPNGCSAQFSLAAELLLLHVGHV